MNQFLIELFRMLKNNCTQYKLFVQHLTKCIEKITFKMKQKSNCTEIIENKRQGDAISGVSICLEIGGKKFSWI